MQFWDRFKNSEEAEKEWNLAAEAAAKKHPLKVLKSMPSMQGITPETAKNLKWKSFYWMVTKDKDWSIMKSVLKKPFLHAYRYLKSLVAPAAFKKDGDFYYYGISGKSDFERLLAEKNNILLLGFSYCHKPFECPSGRFTDQCMRDLDNLVCQQCFIGKASHAAPAQGVVPVYIPTVHDIGRKVFELQKRYPEKSVIFLITACEMTLTMFADWGNLAGIKGVGIRLDGRICNTMKAFELSEEGIKPGLTTVLEPTQKQMMTWLEYRRTNASF